MFVEILDARGTGKLVDMAPIAANALIAQGRAKRAFSDPSPATPPLPGGYRGTTEAEPEALLVVRLDEPTDKPLTAWDTAEKKVVPVFAAPAKAKKHR